MLIAPSYQKQIDAIQITHLSTNSNIECPIDAERSHFKHMQPDLGTKHVNCPYKDQNVKQDG